MKPNKTTVFFIQEKEDDPTLNGIINKISGNSYLEKIRVTWVEDL